MEQQQTQTDSKITAAYEKRNAEIATRGPVTKDLADKIKTENDKKKSAVEAGKIILK